MLPRWLGRDSQQPETTVATPAADEVGFSIRGLILTIMVFVAFGVFEDVLCEVLEARLGLPSLVGAVTAGGLMALLLMPLRRVAQRVGARHRLRDARTAAHRR